MNLINLNIFYLIKKIIDIKWKEFKVKKQKLGTYEIDKRYVLDDGIYTLSYFHKNSVKSCNN